MNATTETNRFSAELKRRFEELTDWAIANSPNEDAPLRKSDFDSCRKEIERLAERDADIGERNAKLPEPSENGPQYVNMNPTPWP
jgi:hypothetical protein